MKQIFKYPIMIIFFAFLLIFAVIDILIPDRAKSELENRPLAQMPDFSFEALIQNKWTAEVAEYTKDQFLLRDDWITMHSAIELAQGKIENSGVWFASDGYQIAQNSFFSATQERMMPLNIQALGQFAARHPGRVHTMIVPSPANVMSFRLSPSPPQIDENAYIDDIYSQLSALKAGPIDLRASFEAKRDRELYYRTDHHWTTDGGAWLAYEEFCAAVGVPVVAPSEAIRRETPGFFGTNFSKSKKFGTKAETIVWYDFGSSLTLYDYVGGELKPADAVGLMDHDALETVDKYSAFLYGITHGYSEIEGSGEGSILVIKDSYGNSFIPYLTQNYAKIGVVELRSLAPDDFMSITQGDAFDTILMLYSFNNFTSDSSIIRIGN